MCGRTACTLAPDDIVRACAFRSRQGKRSRPVWKDPPGGQQYYPCYNVAPAAHTPVLLSSKHYPGELESFSERVVQPMKWGLVPPWHKGDPYKLEFETNNCRAEGMTTKRTYKTALEKGNRCVVLADGFFEWKRGADGKQPYFIYFPQKSSLPDTKMAAPSNTKTKQEPADIKPDLKPDLKSSVKQEPSDVKADVKSNLKPSPQLQVKQEPVDVKPDPDAFPESVEKKEDGNDTSNGNSLSVKHSVKEESDSHSSVEKNSDKTSGQYGLMKEKNGESSTSGQPSLKTGLTSDLASCSVATDTNQTTDAEDEEWQGKRLMTMAGVFDVWKSPDGSPPLYSYSVITVESSPAMAAIHHRMPALLSTEEEVQAWLDFAEVPLAQAVKVIHPSEVVAMHMVSPVVNNSRNKSPECVQVYNPKEVKKTASSNLMMNWLKKANPASGDSSNPPKKQKRT